MKKLALLFIFVFAFSTSIFALPGTKQYEAVWTANVEPDLSGYYLYWRDPGGTFTDANKVDCGLSTSQLLTGVVPNKTELALTAYDTSDNESGFSDIVPFDQDDQAPGSPSGLQIQSLP